MESPTSPESSGTLLVLQLKPFMDFKSQDEYLYAMKEDLAEWFNCLYKTDVEVENFFEFLDTGVRLCEHANNVRNFAQERRKVGLLIKMQSNFVRGIKIPEYEVQYKGEVKPQTFQARDNISNFIRWTKDAGIPDVLSFETDDLVLRKNEKNVVLCLLEIARIGAKLGMLAPTLVQMEEEIDAEIAGDPPPQIITCDVKSLDEMVKWLAGRCTCPVQFPIIKVGEGKYKIGDSQTLVFVRILRNHVMIRVGGGWDTLEHYLDKHDPCRCNYGGHRQGSQRLPTTPRRQSTPALSQTLPSSMKSPRKLSLVSNSYQGSQRPPSPVRMRSASPGPNPRKLPTQPDGNLSGSSSRSSLSSNGNTSSGVNGLKTNSVSTPGNKLRSPSPGPSLTNSKGVPSNRPASPTKRCASPAPAKRCTSPSPARKTPTPSKHKIIATSRSTPNTPASQRRQLPQPKMESNGTTSPGSVPSMDAISTMTLDEFKNLLNSALSVPNGNISEASGDSPRSQSSTDSYRINNTSSKKPPISDSKPRSWAQSKTISNVSKSFDASGRSVKNQTILEKPELPEKPKKILTSSASWNRPKTPTSVSRPKTPVASSNANRPKTPVSVINTNRPKTPVSTVTNRPKTPVSSVTSRPKTPVSSNTSNTSLSTDRPKTPGSNYRSYSTDSYNSSSVKSTTDFSRKTDKSDYSLRSTTDFSGTRDSSSKDYSSLRNSSTDFLGARKTSPARTLSETENENGLNSQSDYKSKVSLRTKSYDGDYENENRPFNNISASRDSDRNGVNTSRDRTNMGSFTGMMASKFSQETTDKGLKSPTIETTSFRSGSDFKAHKPDTSSFSSRSVTMKSEGFAQKEDKPNVGYITINAEENDLSNTRKHGRDPSPNSVVDHVQSRLGLDTREQNRSDCSPTESKFDLFKKTFQSSKENESSKGNSDYLRNNSYSTKSQPDNIPETRTEKNPETERTTIPPSSLPRPSTPSGRCTPSLIPRPATPVGNIKEIKEKAEKLIKEDLSSVTRSIEGLTSSILTSPTNTDAPIKTPSDNTQVAPVSKKIVASVSTPTSGAGRPPTPRKSNILVKSQVASASKGSYTSQFMQRRAMTPGPSKTESKIEPMRRSITPGPSERQNSLRKSESFEIDTNDSNTQNVRDIETRQSRTVPSSPVTQRRPRTPSNEPRSLSRQGAVEEQLLVTVDRSSGQHSINVQRNGESNYKTTKTTGGKIIARSPSANRQKDDSDATDRSRLRSRSVDITKQNARTHSVDRSRGNNPEAVLSISRNDGSHVINKRTEAWVEDAAKTVAKTRHGAKLNKTLPRGYPRSKTPSPMDMRNQESRSLDEIKAALSLPINGINISTDSTKLEAPPEDPEMYATMDKLFEEMRQKELRASVNETPGKIQTDIPNGNHDDEYSLDSNENVKRKVSVPSRTSSRQSTPSRESVVSTPSRPKTPSMSRSSSSSQPIRPASTPPRPYTPTMSKTSSRRSSTSMQSEESESSGQNKKTNITNATILVTKIKEILNVKPRKDNIDGPKTRIPAPASLSKTGKARSFSNLTSTTEKDNPYNRQSFSNGDYNGDIYDDYDECGNEVGYYSRNNGSDSNSDQSDRVRSGSKTPVPKIATPLSTGRTSVLNNPRDKSARLMRAMSASSLSSTTSQTLSYTTGEFDDGYV